MPKQARTAYRMEHSIFLSVTVTMESDPEIIP